MTTTAKTSRRTKRDSAGAKTASQKKVGDSLQNLVTGMGSSRDPRLFTAVRRRGDLSPDDLDTRYAQHDLEHNIVAIPAEDMVREWIDVRSTDDAGERIERVLDAIGARSAMHEGLVWSRLYGGAIAVVGVSKQRPKLDPKTRQPTKEPDLSLPVQPGKVEWLRVFDRHEVVRVVLSPSGAITHYVVRMSDQQEEKIHASRVLRFDAEPRPRRMRDSQAEWGLPVLARCVERIDDLDTAMAGVSVALSRFSETVLKLAGLTELLSMDGGAATAQSRLSTLNLMRSQFGLLTLDGDDQINELARSFSGVPEMLDRLVERVSSAARMPVALLMGRSPAGLNATGDADLRWWYSHVAALQETKLRPPLWRLVELIAAGEGVDIEASKVALAFMPLWRPTQKEEADTHLVQAQADAIYLANGVLTPDIVRDNRFAATGFSVDTVIDDEDADDMDDEEDQSDIDTVDPDDLDPSRLDPEGNPLPAPAPGSASSTPAPATDVQKTALNGAQVQAAMSIVADVAAGKIPRESGVELLVLAFQIPGADAERIMGSAGRGFTPAVASVATTE